MAVQISGNDITVPRDGSFTRNVTIGGTLTYEDVTNIDSVGLVTARNGIEIGARPGVAASISVDGNMIVSGISTFGGAGSFGGAVTISHATPQFKSIDTDGSNDYSTFQNSSGQSVYNAVDNNTHGKHLFQTAGTERMRIDSSGRLLIGTTTEGHTSGDDLTIASSGTTGITIRGATNGGGRIFFSDGTSGDDEYRGVVGYDHTGNHLYFSTNASEALRIDSSGHMGLGVTPNANWPTNDDFKALQIGTGACVFGRGSGDDDRAGLAANYYATGSGNAYLANGHANLIYLNDGNIDFYTAAQNSSGAGAALTLSQILRMNTSGNIKIGNNSDRDLGGLSVQRLHIEGTDGGSSAIGLVNNQNSAGQAAVYFSKSRGTSVGSNTILQDGDPFGSLVFCGSDGNDMISIGAQITASVEGSPGSNDMPGKLVFSTTADGAASPTERMRILPDGRIMTNGLDGDTDITTTGTGDTYDGMQLGVPPLRVTRTSGCPLFLNRNGSGGYIQEWRYGGNIVGYVSNTGNSLPSDRNYKKNITNLSLGLDLVNKLQPVSYHYKFDADSDPVMYGLVAQDVETALNDAGVAQNTAAILQYEEKNDEKDSDYSLDYMKLTPILINAVKELSTEIESLKSEIAALKSS